jgi:hypothetical protein
MGCRLIASMSWKRTITFSRPATVIDCPDDSAAIENAKELPEGQAIEVWITPALSLVSTPRTEGRTSGSAIAVAGLLRSALMRVLYPVRLQRQARQPLGPVDEYYALRRCRTLRLSSCCEVSTRGFVHFGSVSTIDVSSARSVEVVARQTLGARDYVVQNSFYVCFIYELNHFSFSSAELQEVIEDQR